MGRLLIIRHGESTWNLAHRWQGWADAPLTAEGEKQAATRARVLAHDGFKPRALYCSDLGRARRTAEIIGAHLEVPVLPDEGFRERNVGDWSGLTSQEIDERWPGLREQYHRGEIGAPPGGEEDAHILVRWDTALTRVFAHVGDGVAGVVTHGGALRLIAARAGAEVDALIPNLGGFWFDIVNGTLANPEPIPELPTIPEPESDSE